MINGYMTVDETAEKWNVHRWTVQIMCNDGRIEGATKFGRTWAIPIEAEKPQDHRVTSGKYRNWRKVTQEKEISE